MKNVCCIAKVLNCAFFCQVCGVFHSALTLSDSLVTGTWMHDCSAVVCVLAAWDRKDDFDFLQRHLYFPGNAFKLHPDCKYSSSPCAPSPNLTNYKCSTLKQVNLFHLSTCGIISALSLWGPAINRAGIGWKEFFLEGKKLLHVRFCTLKEKWDDLHGVTHHPLELQRVPVAWAVAFPRHFLSMNIPTAFPKLHDHCLSVCLGLLLRSSFLHVTLCRIKYSWTSFSRSGSGAAPSKQREGFGSRYSKGFTKF